MLGTFVNIFKMPDLRNKILFTTGVAVHLQDRFSYSGAGL